MGMHFMLIGEGGAGRHGEAPNRIVESVELTLTRSGAEEGLTVGYEVPVGPVGCTARTITGTSVSATST